MSLTLRTIRFTVAIALFLFAVTGNSYAQTTRKADVIVKKDSSKVEAIILEISESTVKYKKASDPEGPTFSVSKKDLSSIQYGNGEVENFGAAEFYFEENAPRAKSFDNPPPVVRSGSSNLLESRSSEELQSSYRFLMKKAAAYRKMSIVGSTAGILMVSGGIALISSAVSNQNNYSSNNANQAGVGVLLFMGGLGAGIPLTIIGAVKKKSYNKKAMLVQNELRRRGQPTSFHISPGFNPLNQSGYLSLRMTF